MSDLIRKQDAIDVVAKEYQYESDRITALQKIPAVELQTWIPCIERPPEERESIFKKAKGTDKWDPAMFEGISDDVNVTVEFEDGTRKTMTSHTTDGKWICEKNYGIKMKVIAWQPLPEPYKGEQHETD